MTEDRGTARRPVRIANCSGFFGDRLSAAEEMVQGGPIDVLTGDWLAELTMLILARQRMKHGQGSGFARTFLTQMQHVLSDCVERGIRVVTNAGGLDPQGLADRLREFADEAGVEVRIAVVTGDDLAPRLTDLIAGGEQFTNLDTGEKFSELGVPALTANAYLGGRAITAALRAGADVVICGRVTDAALAIGPAAWWHEWDYDDPACLDALAGALVAGHVIECGAQATGGNYSFFADVADMEHIGFPIAEVNADGASVITKHPGTGGLVSVGTVTAQLLYEIGGPAYLNPDVTADFATIRLDQVGKDRVRISGTRGAAPPERLKVSLNYLGGFRNTMTCVLTGLDIPAKAALALRTIAGVGLADIHLPPAELAGRSSLAVSELAVDLIRGDRPDPATIAEAQAHLRVSVKDGDPNAVGKAFTAPAVESALASYPGMFPTAPPGPATPYGVFWPTDVPRQLVSVTVAVDGADPITVAESGLPGSPQATAAAPAGVTATVPAGPRTRAPLGAIAGARSGDKGGTANIGVWIPDPVEGEAVGLAAGEIDALVAPEVGSGEDVARAWQVDDPLTVDDRDRAAADAAYAWLLGVLEADGAVERLIPEAAGLVIAVHRLPSLRAVNIVIKGALGRGVNENTSLDPQAKGLGEYLRARMVEIPAALLDPDAGGDDADD
jgi:Acyclic terpene utilisation family protein AtuA